MGVCGGRAGGLVVCFFYNKMTEHTVSVHHVVINVED